MRFGSAFSALVPIDLRSVRRDPLLRWIAIYPVAAALAVRWGTPWAVRIMESRFGIDLVPYFPLVTSFVLLTAPILAGTVIGFLLLDQRDDGTLAALRVTPLTTTNYLSYRLSVPMVLSALLSLAVIPLLNLVSLSLGDLFWVTVCAAPVAPTYALVLAALAQNKVQGFAVSKAMGVLMVPPVMAYFIKPPWQWLLGLDPLYWPAKMVWIAATGQRGFWAALAIGLLYQSLIVHLLTRRFHRFLSTGA